ncbi:MAG TPA: pyridoxamine 5'-phosphate oxidase family protein [Candidatus Acidoferrales bacterium]|nr:pyridoxamine 5'-phosphate oxidase family protein [Candidatus Acidoferrales bacterium]
MPTKKGMTRNSKPRATRPNMPGYGISTAKKGMLPWRWAEDRLHKSRQYWMVTVRPDGRPHVMPVWGLWRNGAFYFSTGGHSRKARNLAANANCIVCNENAGQGVIVEGAAEIWRDEAGFEELAREYQKKYKIDIRGMNEPFYRVIPRVVFGLYEKKFPTTATRWLFEEDRKGIAV